jgi:ATP-dependent exoDNAse (exonuclease V) beta subunit
VRYTDAQREAILAESHLLMEAGAGCGKTATLVGKVMHALGGGDLGGAADPCELEHIAAITFTEAAAADLKEALRRAFRGAARSDPRWRRRVYELERARIGTIHAFCAGLLREWGPRIGLDPGFRILDAVEGSLLRRDVVREVLFDVLRRGDVDAADLVAEYTFREVAGMLAWAASRAADADAVLRDWCPGGAPRLDELAARVSGGGLSWQPHDPESVRHAATALRLAREVRVRSDRRLDREGALDFDSLIDRVLEAARAHPELVARFRSGLRWLFIDEFQDTDHPQKEIAYRLCALQDEPDAFAPRLCVVGDPKQSIYRFRGADISVWNEVAEDFARRNR